MKTTLYEKEYLICLAQEPHTEYLLTTEHAASSYGIPVAVDAHGNAFGPGELGDLNFVAATGRDHQGSMEIGRAALAAGFKITQARG